MRRSLASLVLALAGMANAQNIPADIGIDWQEADVPPPQPTLRTRGLLPLAVPGSSMKWGVDPASISIGKDRVVRYVVVATGEDGAVTGLYEGLRCDVAQVRVYMRHNAGAWAPASSEWKALYENKAARHSLIVARSGACREHAPNMSPRQIARELAADTDARFSSEGR